MAGRLHAVTGWLLQVTGTEGQYALPLNSINNAFFCSRPLSACRALRLLLPLRYKSRMGVVANNTVGIRMSAASIYRGNTGWAVAVRVVIAVIVAGTPAGGPLATGSVTLKPECCTFNNTERQRRIQ